MGRKERGLEKKACRWLLEKGKEKDQTALRKSLIGQRISTFF